jgi:protein-disulfide isomerase
MASSLAFAMRSAVVAVGVIAAAGCGRTAPARAESSPERRPVAAEPGANGAASVVGDRVVTLDEVDARVGNKLLRLRVEEYMQRRRALQDILAEEVLRREAARRGVTIDAVLDEEVVRKARPVSEQEAAAVYESAPERFRSMPQADAVRSITETLTFKRVSQRRQAFTEELSARAGVRVLLDPPRIVVDASDDPSRGAKDALVTIVEFSDFQCPYCAQMSRILRDIETRYPGHLRIVFRDFPLSMHKDAAKAAEAASCAAEQGKFWEMHDRLFAGQKALGADDLRRYAGDVSLALPRFAACLAGGKYTAEWQADRADGESYGVTGTPALFVNGRPLFGAVTMNDLLEVVDEELSRPPAGRQQLPRRQADRASGVENPGKHVP